VNSVSKENQPCNCFIFSGASPLLQRSAAVILEVVTFPDHDAWTWCGTDLASSPEGLTWSPGVSSYSVRDGEGATMLTSALITAAIERLSFTFRSPHYRLPPIRAHSRPPRRIESGYIQIIRKGNNVHDRKGNGLLTLNSPCE